MRPRFTGLWRHPDFLRLWAGETVSIFGTLIGGLAMQFTAILWLDASAFQVSLLAACQLVPAFAAGLAAGVIADRFPRRPIMIAADIGRAAAFATIPLAAAFDVLTLEQLYAIALTASLCTVFFDVAYEAYLPTLVAPSQLVEGNSKLAASASVAEFSSFSVSGWLVQLLRGPGAILVDALSFLVSAAALLRIRAEEPPARPRHEGEHPIREAAEGVRLLLRMPIVRSIALANVIMQFASRMLSVVLLLYLVREAGFRPGVLGMIFAVGGLTSLIGAWLASRPHWFGGLGRAMALSAALRATGALCIPLATGMGFAGVALLVANQCISDPAWTFYEINDISLRQALTPNFLQGRLSATVRFGEFGAALLGTAAGGVLGLWLGLRETLFLAVGVTYLAGIWLAFSPVMHLGAMPVRSEEELETVVA